MAVNSGKWAGGGHDFSIILPKWKPGGGTSTAGGRIDAINANYWDWAGGGGVPATCGSGRRPGGDSGASADS